VNRGYIEQDDLSGTLADVLDRVQSVAAGVQRLREEASQLRAAA